MVIIILKNEKKLINLLLIVGVILKSIQSHRKSWRHENIQRGTKNSGRIVEYREENHLRGFWCSQRNIWSCIFIFKRCYVSLIYKHVVGHICCVCFPFGEVPYMVILRGDIRDAFFVVKAQWGEDSQERLKVRLGACVRMQENCSLWGDNTSLVLGSTIDRQLCAVVLPKTTLGQFLMFSILCIWSIFGSGFFWLVNYDCKRYIIIVCMGSDITHLKVVLLIYWGVVLLIWE